MTDTCLGNELQPLVIRGKKRRRCCGREQPGGVGHKSYRYRGRTVLAGKVRYCVQYLLVSDMDPVKDANADAGFLESSLRSPDAVYDFHARVSGALLPTPPTDVDVLGFGLAGFTRLTLEVCILGFGLTGI